ncbi:hypothetical protein NIES593_22360 [Hydrococcus rivularis NIES-593]|uniref:Uncharacterized protein n=1 Tax=Hydrococcus rivularis NIES-593 TaxID=1921803 RepID=A0A1U7H7L5_9CYAN|nr:hypothetical protein [Hydrococcus rivularis]OKH18264.1 hypothetical protein NIES593_22360 [Hydrococcus rivularis NIES-593]
MKFTSFNLGKSPSTPALTLLVAMIGSGLISASIAYKMGRDALKGVSQPDANPAKRLASNANKDANPQEFVPLDEKKILTQVYNRINGRDRDEKSDLTNKDRQNLASSNEEPKSSQTSSEEANFPLKTSDREVSLEVVKATQKGGSLLLEVNLSNEGSAPVQFLYSFLEVKDKKGRPLSAIVEGLPGELPANGESFTGIVRIPLELVDEGQQISLNLTDYPAQKLKLNISNIPVR